MLRLVLAALAASAPAVTAASPVPSGSRQLLLSLSPDWDATRATLQAHERSSATAAWVAVGPAFPASLGRSGLAWGRGLHPSGLAGPGKREGDGRSPAGVFALRSLTGYAPERPAGVRLPYRPATASLRCVDDVRSRFYNQLVDEASVARDWSSAEAMRRADELYRHVVWVGHNDTPVEPGGGSCIFLHLRVREDAVTAGCTAFEAEAMDRLLRWLSPQAEPVLVQLPRAEYAARAADWGLPPAPEANAVVGAGR